jgi:hypothetical protein
VENPSPEGLWAMALEEREKKERREKKEERVQEDYFSR